MRSIRGVVLFATGIAIVFALAGCAATGTDAAPSPSGTSSIPAVTETPTPTPVATVTKIKASPTGLTLLGSDGTVIHSLPNTSDPAAVLAALKNVFGKEPALGSYAGGEDAPGGTTYNWDGFTVKVGMGPMFSGGKLHFAVATTTAKSGNVEIAFGTVRVGDTIAQLKAAGGKLGSTFDGGPGDGSHDGDYWDFGETTSQGLSLYVTAKIKSGAVGALYSPVDANGS